MLLALWKEQPAKWREITGRIDAEPTPLSIERISQMIEEACGGPESVKALVERHRDWAQNHIRMTQNLMAANMAATGKEISLPQVMIADKLILGAISEVARVHAWTTDHLKLAAITPAALARHADASDPCEASLKNTCGRLIITVISAGEPAGRSVDDNTKSLPNDVMEYDAINHTRQLVNPQAGGLPTYSLAITSDTTYIDRVKADPRTAKNFLGAMPMAKDKFADFLSSDIKKNLIRKALANFGNNKACSDVMKKLGLTNVASLLKVEVVFEGEYDSGEKAAIRAWKDHTGSGTLGAWGVNPAFMTEKDWQDMFSPLEGATTHIFANSCRAEAVGARYEKALDEANMCNCFVASTGAEQEDLSGGGHPPTWNNAMADKGKSLRQIDSKAKWDGANSITEMEPTIYSKYKDLLLFNPATGKTLPSDLAYTMKSRNPMMGFVNTSLDSAALGNH